MLHPTPVLKETPSQTAGPYVHIGMTPNFAELRGVYDDPGEVMLDASHNGPRITLTGRIFDGSGAPVADAVLEIWQADADGNYVKTEKGQAKPSFTGWGRKAVSDDGRFVFDTLKPGRVKGPDGKLMAPHVSVWIVARGINMGLQTRIYFGDEEEANASDFILNKVQDVRRRKTLIARQEGENTYVLDIHLQGENETVFFDF